MKKIPVEELKPGMVFTRTVFADNYEIIAEAGKPITSKDIANLIKKGVKFIETSGEVKEVVKLAEYITEKDDIDAKTSDLESFYKSAESSVDGIYANYKVNKELDPEKVISVVESILRKITEVDDKNIFINLVHSVDKSRYLSSHAMNTCILGLLLAKELGYTETKIKVLGTSLLLMDIGMVFVPMSILEREGKLIPEEFNKIKAHTVLGYKAMVQENNMSPEVGRVALEHHERFDGSGYPRGLSKLQISEYSRIAGIVDTYEAMTSKRVYKDKMMSFNAMRTILSEGSTKFDPNILNGFLRMMSVYPVGSYVLLNTNAIAKVISSDPASPFRPVIKIVYDEFKIKVEEGEAIKLAEEDKIYITRAISEEEIDKLIY